VTDRIELDEQIEGVFKGVEEQIYRTKSGADLIARLNSPQEWLMCSLIHKFGRSEAAAVDEYIADLQRHLPRDFRPKGDIFVFVDEAHRTQSGKLHRAMKAILPNAMLIGFTGTPLLKRDKQTTVETFGPYIHTYKYDEAVADGVVLDLVYEARDIDQRLTSPGRVDKWFEAKTRGLTDYAKAQIKRRWGRMQELLSSQSRLAKIVDDILLDMETRPRLMDGQGNALLVCSSIYQACKFYELFSRTPLKGKCAIVTSYRPNPADIAGEETGEGLTEKLRQYEIYRRMLADFFEQDEEQAMYRVDEFEQTVKEWFIHEPGRMKLLIVVDKLLTGFDAPPATYLYIDKPMRDHGLFQAICRVNRLHTEDKEYGYIIDYRDLFQSLQTAVHDYTGGAFEEFDREDVEGLLTNRLDKGRQRLDEALEQVRAICEPVPPPRDSAAYLHYFVAADTGDKDAIKENEPRRVALYKAVARLLRAYANLANEMTEAGYSASEAQAIKREVGHYEKVREEVRLASGDYVDMKMFEPAMRHLLDTYIQAEESQVVAKFEEQGLVDLFINNGLDALLSAMPQGLQSQPEAMTEAIENNIRRLIIDEQPVNPKYYEKMSQLLDELIAQRKTQAIEYQEYLKHLQQLAEKVKKPEASGDYPPSMTTAAQRALFDNLGRNAGLALRVDAAIQAAKKDGWRGNLMKERAILSAIAKALQEEGYSGERVAEQRAPYVTGDTSDPSVEQAIKDTAERILNIAREQNEY
ncbi:HsdR family type I site-specific deoxyribonuclease, partial [Candidatus Parcubacteria bacterium]